MTEQEGQPASAALFVGGPYDGQVITVPDDLGVAYARGRAQRGLPGVEVVAYHPTTVVLFGREVRAFAAEGLADGRPVRMTAAVQALWATTQCREPVASSC